MPTSLPLTTRAPASAQPPKPIRWLALAHFANDFFSGSLGILLAAQANQLGLSNAQIGNAAGLFLLLSLSQPFLGWIADRTGRTDVMLTGPFWTALGLLICGLAESYLVVLMGVLVGGMGNAMFHPSALANARAFGGLRGKGRSVALFMLGGNGGFGVGPFLAGFLLDAMGPPGIAPYALVSFVLVPLLVWRLLPYSRDRLADIQTETASDAAPSAGPQIAPRWRTVIGLLGAYLVIVLVRGIPNQGFSTFMP
ncbi:MAG: MFS transporter, partial [Chloroflexi bacterium]|nr:MFS transporter [Chloroflexota bacterium]